ncbi:hypothetical protein CYMTET_23256 [Cymbomonas tetramitiformis]|uniref:Polycystin cation channel PKD1/PKD2 domain-containing protein n=1 Tax=Cymbomonas tetramitiformis TaxID=36881 RepID=A0AAE0FYN2_9CHLO|nr:hypothetical protein CYMTET_23256 [Cymbomonas tetramitiformis]
MEALRTRWHENRADIVRIVLEVAVLLLFFSSSCSELRDLIEMKRTTGSVLPYFTDLFNVIDITAILLLFSTICIYVVLLVKMDGFNLAVRYHIYESLTGTDEFGEHVNWLQLHDDGRYLSEFSEKLDYFTEMMELKKMYHFYTALVIVTTLLRVLKLMDFHPDIGMITRTVRQGGTDLINFMGLLVTIMLIYAIMGYILFGNTVERFNRLDYSLLTCFAMMIGDTAFSEDIPNLEGKVAQSTGSIFFYSFMTLVFLFLFSAFIAIIVSALEDVKRENIGEPKSDLITDFTDLAHYYGHTLAANGMGLLRRLNVHTWFPWLSTVTEDKLYMQLNQWNANIQGASAPLDSPRGKGGLSAGLMRGGGGWAGGKGGLVPGLTGSGVERLAARAARCSRQGSQMPCGRGVE